MRLVFFLLSVVLGLQVSLFGQENRPDKEAPGKDTKRSKRSSKKSDYTNDLAYVLKLSTAQKDLELSDAQAKIIMGLNRKISEGHGKLYEEYPELNDKNLDRDRREEIIDEIREKFRKLREKIDSQIMDNLVPRQKTLLKKVRLKHYLRSHGFSTTLTRTDFAQEFEVSDEQKDKMQKLRIELESEIQKLILDKRKEGIEKMKRLLNASQRKKLKELDGDKATIYNF